jgi:cytidyltransferase-like protein
MESFKDFINDKPNLTRIGFFAGGFKPPHLGHYEVAKQASKANDQVMIFIGKPPRPPITVEISKAIWDIFAKTLPNLDIQIAPVSPVRSVYEKIEDLNKRNDAAAIGVTLYTDKDDMPRYERIGKYTDNLAYTNLKETPRILSATKVRGDIMTGNWQAVLDSMPDEVDVRSILDILRKSVNN